MEGSALNNSFFQSGIFALDTMLAEKLSGGGEVFNMPFWKDDSVLGVSDTAVEEGSTLTVNKIETGNMIARRHFRASAFGKNDLAGVLAGDNPGSKILSLTDNYWVNRYQDAAFSTIQGVIADNIANDGSDMVNTISSTINYDDVVDTQLLLGDMSDGFAAIAVHSKQWGDMVKDNAIDYIRLSDQGIDIPTYQGMRIIKNDALYDGTNYWAIVFKPGAFAFAESFNNYEPTEVSRNELTHDGQEYYVTRRVFGLHPYGFQYTDGTITADFPTNTELEAATRWDRVLSDVKNARFAVLKTV